MPKKKKDLKTKPNKQQLKWHRFEDKTNEKKKKQRNKQAHLRLS